MKQRDEIFCTRCGDVKACFHFPDAIIQRVYASEMKLAEQRGARRKRVTR
jgi:hypothetical protein